LNASKADGGHGMDEQQIDFSIPPSMVEFQTHQVGLKKALRRVFLAAGEICPLRGPGDNF
jgi:hypothetical protein